MLSLFYALAMITYTDIIIRSKAGVPSCCVVFGSSTAGGAYTPGMSDYVIMVKVYLKQVNWK